MELAELWENITDDFRSCARSISTGETESRFLLAPGYGLHEAMMCPCVGDPKVDVTLAGRLPPQTIEDSWKQHGLPRGLSKVECLDSLNGLICTVVNWIRGDLPSTTLCRSLFLHRPGLLKECEGAEELVVGTAYLMRIIIMIRSAVFFADIHKEEDFSTQSYGLFVDDFAQLGDIDGFTQTSVLHKRSKVLEEKCLRSGAARGEENGLSAKEKSILLCIAHRLRFLRSLFSLHVSLYRSSSLDSATMEAIHNGASKVSDCSRLSVFCHLHCCDEPISAGSVIGKPAEASSIAKNAEEMMQRVSNGLDAKRSHWNGGFDADIALLVCGWQQQASFFLNSLLDYVGDHFNLKEGMKRDDCPLCRSLREAFLALEVHSLNLEALCDGISGVDNLQSLFRFAVGFVDKRPLGSVVQSPDPSIRALLDSGSALRDCPPDFVVASHCYLLSLSGKRPSFSGRSFAELVFDDLVSDGIRASFLECQLVAPIVDRLTRMVNRFLTIVLENRGRQRRMLGKFFERPLQRLGARIEQLADALMDEAKREENEKRDIEGSGPKSETWTGTEEAKRSKKKRKGGGIGEQFQQLRVSMLPQRVPQEEWGESVHRMQLWLFRYTLQSVARYVLLGFHLELYASRELVTVYWYLDYLFAIRTRILGEIRSRLQERHGVEKGRKRSDSKHSALESRIHAFSTERGACEALQICFHTLVQLILVLMDSALVNPSVMKKYSPFESYPHSTPQSLFDQRFEVLEMLGHPLGRTFDSFFAQCQNVRETAVQQSSGSISSLSSILESFSNAFGRSRTLAASVLQGNGGVEPSCSMMPSMKSVQQVSIGNVLSLKALVKMLERGETVTSFSLDFSYCESLPVIKVR